MTSALKTQESSTPQTVSKQELMQESPTNKQTVLASVKLTDSIETLGNLYDDENKTHAGSRVYSSEGLSPTLMSAHFGMEKWIIEVKEDERS